MLGVALELVFTGRAIDKFVCGLIARRVGVPSRLPANVVSRHLPMNASSLVRSEN